MASVFLCLIVASASYAADIEAAGIWLFDEVNGDKVAEVSGTGIEGEISGNYKYVAGKFGEALEFNGENTSVLFENDDPTQAYILHRGKDVSLVFWAKPSSGDFRTIFWTRGDGADADRFNIHSGPGPTLGFDYREVNGNIHQGLYENVPLPINEWTHIAISREENTYNTYSNGNLVSQGEDQNPALPQSISWMLSRPAFIFGGIIDEIGFFESVLNENDVASIMENGLESTTLAVAPSGKISTTWARLKRGK